MRTSQLSDASRAVWILLSGTRRRSSAARRTVRIRPSYNALGALPDLELLVQARAGVPTQIMAHRPGPAFGDLSIASIGAGLSAAVGALAGLYARESTGRGGWAETSLGRVAAYQWDDLGQVEQPRFPPRCGPPWPTRSYSAAAKSSTRAPPANSTPTRSTSATWASPPKPTRPRTHLRPSQRTSSW